MILSEASKKYEMPLDRLCKAVSVAGIEPTGERQGKRRMLKEYAEKDVVEAIIAEYKRRYLAQKLKADHWKIKANCTIALYRKDNKKPEEDDDL